MMLHLKASKGAGWSDQDLEKVAHQAIGCPTSVNGMLHNLHNYGSTAEFFWDEKSIATIGLKSWCARITSNLIIYESLAVIDKKSLHKSCAPLIPG